MVRFTFEIEDAPGSSEPEQSESGGHINLEELKPSSGRAWDVGPPDPRAPSRPVEGGAVELTQGQSRHVVESPAQGAMEAKGVGWDLRSVLVPLIPAVVLTLLGFLGFGFVSVVSHDIAQNKLDLQTYMKVVGWFAGGLLSLVSGVMTLKKLRPDKRKQGDGSG